MSFPESSVLGAGKLYSTAAPIERRTDDEKRIALNQHKNFLSGSNASSSNGSPHSNGHQEETETTPLFSGVVLDGVPANTFKQYGLLGEQVAIAEPIGQGCLDFNEQRPFSPTEDDPRIFVNVSPPWSAFVCGSQGSGKSHTLSCILENCLIPSKLGQLPRPLTGMVFHYDTFTSYGSNQVCEAAYLCSSGIPVRVLVSPTNYWRMKDTYENLPGLSSDAQKPEVIAMKFQDKHLNVTRMMNLMAVNEKEGAVPLYIEVILRILREMAIKNQGASGFDYNTFRKRLDEESFTGQQHLPLKLRLDLLESFMDRPIKAGQTEMMPVFANDRAGKHAKRQWLEQMNQKIEDERASRARAWNFEPGILTIVDLSCPFVGDNAACALFNICLELFLESRGSVGRIVGLDEAHKFMTSSASAATFTENLLQIIRQQRHLATRVVISTQEPTISPKLLDLSTMTIVHRFTSPEWFRTLRDHLAGVSMLSNTNSTEVGTKRDVARIFAEIVGLGIGESLLFSPAAMLNGIVAVGDAGVNNKRREVMPGKEVLPEKLGTEWVKMRVRKRLTEDGGRSIMAV